MARRKKAEAPPALAATDAKTRIEAAAAAAGLSPAELGSLLVDAGLTCLPPSDGITETYTLGDLGLKLWTEASALPRGKRSNWFHGLIDVQQRAVIVALRDRGYAGAVIAQEFGLDKFEVLRTWNSYADQIGEQVVGLRLNTIAGQMQIVKERAQQMAIAKDDPKGYWGIEKEFVAKLQDLGIVDRAIHRVEHTHRFDDAAKAEIDAVFDLERKKRVAAEDLKQIEANVFDTDPLPDSSAGPDMFDE